MKESSRDTCRTCKWFYTEDQKQGECRVSRPQVTVIMVPQPPTVASRGQPIMSPMPIAAFPNIGSPDHIWCGDHESLISLSFN